MNDPSFRNVLVLGAGTIGSQIGLQCALYGVHATLFDVAADRLASARAQHAAVLADWVKNGEITAAEAAAAERRIAVSTDPASACDADLLCESVPEQLKLKREVFSQFGRLCPPQTIFTTNSSYFPPSQLAASSGRPDRFAALHFHSPVWYANVVDIMPQRQTSPATIERLTAFARQIGQTPIVARKEHPGYVYNTMLWQFLVAAMQLAGDDVASVEDIDRAWMGVMKTPIGPFGILDLIGLDTVQNIVRAWPQALKDARVKPFIDRLHALVEAGHLGEKSGQGLYRHPGPSYREPGFVTQILADRKNTETASPASVLDPAGDTAADEGSNRTDASAKANVVERFTLEMVPRPIDPRIIHQPTLFGAAWILGENAAARALATRLSAGGATVRFVPQTGGTAEAQRWIAEQWQAEPAPHLFLVNAWDEERHEAAAPTLTEPAPQAQAPYAAEMERRLLLPYVVCQQWFALASETPLLDRATLLAATALGGDFGISGNVEHADGGALSGLLKAVFMEGAAMQGLGPQVKVVDFAAEVAHQQVAEALCQELALAQAAVQTGDPAEFRRRFSDIEVGYAQTQRLQVRLRPAAVKSPPAGQAAAVGPAPGGNWVVTGGARGVTAYVAAELGRRYGVRLHLIGSSPLADVDYRAWTKEQTDAHRADVMRRAVARREKPNVAWDRVARQIEIQQNLARLSEAGIQASYHACDLGDRAALAQVLQRVRDVDGPIAGVIHGAGVERTGRFTRKTLDVVRSTLIPKFQGTLGLIDLTRSDPLRWFVVFGSLSGRFGGVGQTDYAMANDLAAKLVAGLARQRPECRSVLIHWPGWSDIGMAARSDSQWSLQHNAHHQLMPPQEGWLHLENELLATDRPGEVVLVNPKELPGELLEGPETRIA